MDPVFKKVDYQNHAQGEDLLTLLNVYAHDPMGGGEGLSDFAKSNLLKELRKIPHAFSIIGYLGEQPVALANCFEVFSTFKCKGIVNIHDFVVLPEQRGIGLSQKLMDAVEQEAVNRGCCKLTLEVLEGNKVARNAYVKFGFEGYELDPEAGKALFMEKEIV